MKTNSGTRYEFIDIARLISSIGVILCHLESHAIKSVVYAFNFPVFLLITGFFISRDVPIKDFVKKQARRLLLPYYVTCLCIIVLGAIIGGIAGGKDVAVYAAREWANATVFGVASTFRTPFYMRGIGALWSLWGIFWASCFLRILLEFRKETRLIIICVLFFLAKWSSGLVFLPLSIQPGCIVLFYLYVGYLTKQALPYLQQLPREIIIAWSVFAALFWFAFIRGFQSFWIVICDTGHGITDVFGSLCASYCVLLISYYLQKVAGRAGSAMAFLGRNIIFLYCAHSIENNLFPWNSLFARLGLPESGFLIYNMVCKVAFALAVTILCAKIKQGRRRVAASS